MRDRRDIDGEPRGPRVSHPGAHAPRPPASAGRSPADPGANAARAPGRSLAHPSALAIASGATTVLPGFLVGALALQIRADLDVSVATVAVGVTVFFAAGALGAGPGGRLAERLGALRAIRGCVVATAACLVLAAVAAHSLGVLLALLAVAGLANAITQPAINLFMADQVPLARQGLAFGIKQAAIPAAVLVSGLALPLLALPLGWRPTFAICAAGALTVAVVVTRSATSFAPAPRRDPAPRPSRALIVTALGGALASAGPNALGAYLVASAVDVGIAEGVAGLLAAAGSGASLLARVVLGESADRRRDYGFAAVVVLLVTGSLGFALLATGEAAAFVIGVFVAFSLGWGWPGLFNLAVVDLHRHAPGAATGVSQTGIYVGAAGGPAACGLVSAEYGYPAAWALAGVLCLSGALAFAYASRLARGRVAV
jgi:predicted MFS family arabinose efflux permease